MPRQLFGPYLKLNADKQADCWFAYSREENGTLNFYVKGLSEGSQYTKYPELFDTPFFALENTQRMVFFKRGDSFIRQFLTPDQLGRTLAEDIGDRSSKSPNRSDSLAFKLLENIPEYHGNPNNLELEIPADTPVVAADTPVVAEDAPVVAADAPVVAADTPVVAANAPHSFSLDALTYEMELTRLQTEIKNHLKESWPFNNIPNDGSRQKTIYQICLGILGGHCSELSEDIQHSIRTIRHRLMIDEYIVKDYFADFPDTPIFYVSGFVCNLINKIHDINKCENEDLPMSKVFPERLRGKTILMFLKEQYIELLKEQKFSDEESLVEKVSEIKGYLTIALKRSLDQDDVEQELDALVKQANDEQEAQDLRVALALGDLDAQAPQERANTPVAHETGNAIIQNLPALEENNIASHPKSFFNSPKTAGLVGGATGASIWGGVAAALILCCSKALPFIIITVMIAALLTAITALAFQKCLGPSIQNA